MFRSMRSSFPMVPLLAADTRDARATEAAGLGRTSSYVIQSLSALRASTLDTVRKDPPVADMAS